MTNNYPIDYTSRDYSAIRDDLVQLVRSRLGVDWQANDPSDMGVALVEAFAYMGDIMSYYLDRAANESFIDTATQRDSLLNLANLFGFRPSGPTPAAVTVTFSNIGLNPIDLPKGTQVIAPLQFGDYSEVFFETDEAVTQLEPGASVSIVATEGKTANTDRPDLIDPATNLPIPVVLGTSNGKVNQSFTLPDTGVVDGSVKAFIGQGVAFNEWSYVDSLLEWGPFDRVFTTRLNVDGSTSIVFGDGVNGAIPTSSQLVSSLYRVSVGLAGNVTSGQITEVSFIPGNIDPNATASLTVNNTLAAKGGANPDDTRQIKSKLKKAISSRRRAVTLDDYEALAVSVPKVGKAKSVSSNYSFVTLYIQPQNDFSISPGVDLETDAATSAMLDLVSDVQEYMVDKIPATTTLTVKPPTYVDLEIEVIVNVGSAYKQADVQAGVSQALLDRSTGLFSYNTYNFGDTVAFSDVVSAISRVQGVVSVTIVKLGRIGDSAAADVVLQPSELPRLLSAYLDVTLLGGLL